MAQGPERRVKEYMKYTSLGLQMAGIILLCTLGGHYLDGYFNLETPWLTIGLAMFGVMAAMVFLFKGTATK